MKQIIIYTIFLLMSMNSKAQTQYVFDGSFEATNPITYTNPNWVDSSHTFFGHSIFLDSNYARTGKAYVLFYSTGSLPQTQNFVYQDILLPQTTYNNTLEFYMYYSNTSGSIDDILEVGMFNSSANIFLSSGLSTDSAKYGNHYTKVSLKIDTIFGGLNKIVFLFSAGSSNGYGTSILIDDVKLTSGYPTAINDVCNNIDNILIYPTIVQNNINFENISDNNSSIYIYNIMGQLIQKNNLNQSALQSVSVMNLPIGQYFLELKNEKGMKIKTIKIEKI